MLANKFNGDVKQLIFLTVRDSINIFTEILSDREQIVLNISFLDENIKIYFDIKKFYEFRFSEKDCHTYIKQTIFKQLKEYKNV